jgi:hypothetical protein
VVREGLRLAHAEPDRGVIAPLEVILEFAARHAPTGTGDTLSVVHHALELHERAVLSRAEVLFLAAHAAVHETRGLRAWSPPAPIASRPESEDDRALFLADMLEEQTLSALARVRGACEHAAPVAIVDAWLVPLVSLKLWDRDAALVRVVAARHVLPLLDPASAKTVLLSLVRRLAYSVAESDLPPWRATRQALFNVQGCVPGTAVPDALTVGLSGTERESLAFATTQLRDGTAPGALLDALAGVALERVRRYDPSWSARLQARVHALEVARAFSYCVAARALEHAVFAPAHVVLAAGWTGKLARYARSEARDAQPVEPDAWRARVRWACLEARTSADGLQLALALAHGAVVWVGESSERRAIAHDALVHALEEDRPQGYARRAHHAERAALHDDVAEEDL